MRILLVSNAGWTSSGYGVQVRHIARLLKNAGHDIAVSAFFGLQGNSIEWKGIKHYPVGFIPYGNDVIPLHAEDFNADIVIGLIDVWVIDPRIISAVHYVPWAPIDHTPVPGPVLDRLRISWSVMSYSRFGVEEIDRVGLKAHYVPLGVDTEVFHPMPERKDEIRTKFGIPSDAFVVGMVAANQTKFPTRKGFERIFPAIANLHRKHKDIYLYVHTYVGLEMGGVPLVDLARTFGAEDFIYFSNPDIWRMGGLTRQELAELYNSFDILAMPSTSEGFGIPAVEAQACGIPVTATDFSACKELCASGWLIEPVTLYMTNLLAFQALPNVRSIEDNIERAYNLWHTNKLTPYRKQARQFALAYSWDNLFETYWLPMLSEWEERLTTNPSAPVSSSVDAASHLDTVQQNTLEVNGPDGHADVSSFTEGS